MQQDFEFWGLTPQAARPQIDNLLLAWCHLKLPVSLIFSPDGAPLLQEEKGQARIKTQRGRKVAPRRGRAFEEGRCRPGSTAPWAAVRRRPRLAALETR